MDELRISKFDQVRQDVGLRLTINDMGSVWMYSIRNSK
jgi:hypothetical protein